MLSLIYSPNFPSPPGEDISSPSALSDPDDLGIYLIRACGLTTPSCLVPGFGLGGLVSPPDTPVPDGLLLTNYDFRTYRAPMPPPYMVGTINCPYAISTDEPRPSYFFGAHDDAPRPPSIRFTRSQTEIFAGNTSSRADYRMVSRREFAAFAGSARPPLLPSPPPRSVRLDSTNPLLGPFLFRLTLARCNPATLS